MHLEPHATIFLLEGTFHRIPGVLKKLFVRDDVIELVRVAVPGALIARAVHC